MKTFPKLSWIDYRASAISERFNDNRPINVVDLSAIKFFPKNLSGPFVAQRATGMNQANLCRRYAGVDHMSPFPIGKHFPCICFSN